MTEDFSDHPKTIGELRSEKSDKASDWTPRDALISLLRDIDSGVLKPTSCVVIVGSVDELNRTETTLRQATPNLYVTLGLINRAIYFIQRDT